MHIVYHLGAHCTDEDRLVRCLLKNRAVLAEQGIAVPSPTRYRRLLRDTAMQLDGADASAETQAMILDQILDGDTARRMILSWESFLAYPQWALRGAFYPAAGARIHAFTRIFPGIACEFHLAIRNPATFLPALFERQKGKSHEEFLGGIDPLQLRWSEVIRQILSQNPGVALTVWCDEDTPLIWAEILQAVSGHDDTIALEHTDELLAMLMSEEGFRRMHAYFAKSPPATVRQRQRATTAFLERFARPDRIEVAIDMPGWTRETVAALTSAYHRDVARIAELPGVRVIAP